MRARTPALSLALSVLALAACAGPTPVERHWGEAKRNANEAMVASAQHQPGPGLDGVETNAAYIRYLKSLRKTMVINTVLGVTDTEQTIPTAQPNGKE